MGKFRVVAVAGVVAGVAFMLPAQAAEPRRGVLECTNGDQYDVDGQLHGAAWGLTDSTQQFVVTYLEVDLTGVVLVKRSPGKQRLDTLSCTYTVSSHLAPGDTATVEGFLTPRVR